MTTVAGIKDDAKGEIFSIGEAQKFFDEHNEATKLADDDRLSDDEFAAALSDSGVNEHAQQFAEERRAKRRKEHRDRVQRFFPTENRVFDHEALECIERIEAALAALEPQQRRADRQFDNDEKRRAAHEKFLALTHSMNLLQQQKFHIVLGQLGVIYPRAEYRVRARFDHGCCIGLEISDAETLQMLDRVVSPWSLIITCDDGRAFIHGCSVTQTSSGFETFPTETAE